jgi:hypothetical protein
MIPDMVVVSPLEWPRNLDQPVLLATFWVVSHRLLEVVLPLEVGMVLQAVAVTRASANSLPKQQAAVPSVDLSVHLQGESEVLFSAVYWEEIQTRPRPSNTPRRVVYQAVATNKSIPKSSTLVINTAKLNTLRLNSQVGAAKPITSATNNRAREITAADSSNAPRLALPMEEASSRLQSEPTNVRADTCKLKLGVKRAADMARRSTSRILILMILTRRRRSTIRSAILILMMIVLVRLNRSMELQVDLEEDMRSRRDKSTVVAEEAMVNRERKASVEVMAERDKNSKSLLVKSMAVDMEKSDVNASKNLPARNMVDVKNMVEAMKLAGARERNERTNIKRSAVRSTVRRDAKRAVGDGSLRFACMSSRVVGKVSEA